MSGELPFIDVDGLEVANGYRTMEYLRRGLAGPKWIVPETYPCSVLAREVGGVGPFVSPSADPAPWYDATIAESANFYGFMPTIIDFQTLSVTRSQSQRFGGIGGGVIGVEQVAVRGMHVDGYLLASTCQALEYGRHWLYSKIGSDCAGCNLRTVRVRESCPPADGSADTRGERILYDAALTAGITRTDNPGSPCCDYDGIHFEFASESPYLYSRPGAASTPVYIGSSGGIIPTNPAVLDTFVRANAGPPPSASWSGPIVSPGENNNLVVATNLLQSNTHVAGTTGSAYWNAASFGPDVMIMQLVPTKANNGTFELRARITGEGTAGADWALAQIRFSTTAGQDACWLGRHTTGLIPGPTGLTFANNDTFALVCRGNLLELWRKPNAANWLRVMSAYDTIATPVAGRVGVAIIENGATQTLSTLSAGTLTNGSVYPKDVVSIALPSQKIGILAPIITLTDTDTSNSVPVIANGVRVQLKPYLDCDQTDNFAVNNKATRWTESHAGDWNITGGFLVPTVTGLDGGVGRDIFRRDSASAAIAWPGGKVQADITTGASVTAGAWGVGMGTNIVAVLNKGAGSVANVFALSNDINGTYGLDSVAFTPLANTFYRIIMEVLPTAIVGQYDVRAYLVDANNVMLTRPIRSTMGTLNALGPTFAPAITSAPAGTDEKWDSFYAIDYSDSAQYMQANFESGVLVIDAPRRIVQFTPNGSSVTQDGSGRVSTPIDTPLGWPDLCAGVGPACLQVFASEVAQGSNANGATGSGLGLTMSYQLQQRVR